ncbi:MAG TPA: ribosome maturation factor RimM [Woeseiaceae bacterium]|nr:ribosome maturation factor RimM [Woeseiaceae bacterium]
MPANENSVADGEVVLGRVSAVFGIKGWLKVHSYTEPRDAILAFRNWSLELDGKSRRVTVTEGRKQGNSLVVCIDGVTDRDTAATLLGAEIRVPRAQLPKLPEGQYYWGDLQGMQVRHRDGRLLGNVAYLMATGANDVLVVQVGKREILIPFITGKVILGVDTNKGVISVDWEWD